MSSPGSIRRRLPFLFRLVLSLGRTLRTGWLIVGVGLGVLVAAEVAYRLQAALRTVLREWRSSPQPTHSVAVSPWPTAAQADAPRFDELVWHPYVYYRRRPFRGRYAVVDSLSHRWTLPVPGSGTHRRVFIFGASPIWGTGLTDSTTIPSRVAAELTARGVRAVDITNFGETGYVFTQEVIELMLQLRAGARPSVVVFCGGLAEVEAAIGQGHAGVTEREADRARDFDVGRQVFSWHSDLSGDIRALLELGSIASRRLELRTRFGLGAQDLHPPDDSLVTDIASTYLGTVDLVEALAARYGFVPFYVWLPVLEAGAKPMTPFERHLFEGLQQQSATRSLLHLFELTGLRIGPAATHAVPGRYADLGGLFSRDTGTVFLDGAGDVNGAGSAAIGAELAGLVTSRLNRRQLR